MPNLRPPLTEGIANDGTLDDPELFGDLRCRRIRRDEPACLETGKIDFDAVNVAFQDGSAPADTFFYVGDATGCSTSSDKSWYYDDPDEPAHVVLCPKTCERVSAASSAKVSIAFGCKRHDLVR